MASLPTLPPVGVPSGTPQTATRPPPAADPAQIAESARDFEAMAIGQLLQPMFDTLKTANGLFGGGAGEEAWKPMLVQAFAKQIGAHGGCWAWPNRSMTP